jgi:hypothetical protein
VTERLPRSNLFLKGDAEGVLEPLEISLFVKLHCLTGQNQTATVMEAYTEMSIPLKKD